jgi:hypothetical protein
MDIESDDISLFEYTSMRALEVESHSYPQRALSWLCARMERASVDMESRERVLDHLLLCWTQGSAYSGTRMRS